MKNYNSILVLGALAIANGQQLITTPPNAPFAILGHIEEFKLVPSPGHPDLQGAILKVNGIKITVPRNLIVQMPGTYLTPADIFRGPQGTAGSSILAESGLALNDATCLKLPTPAGDRCIPYEAEVIGDIVTGEHIAGMVKITQQGLNAGEGIVKDVVNGVITVSGKNGDARLKINDPNGRFGPAASDDRRFKVDDDNPTVTTLTGYPACVKGPGTVNCVDSNRPAGITGNRYTVGAIPQPSVTATCTACDPTKPVPLRAGDFVTYSGTLLRDASGIYISVHTLRANIAVFTAPGSGPVYIAIEETRLGGGGRPFTAIRDIEAGPGKKLPPPTISTEFRIVGFTTDPTTNVVVQSSEAHPVQGEANMRFRTYLTLSPAFVPLGRFRGNVGQTNLLPTPREVRAFASGRQDIAVNGAVGGGYSAGTYTAPVSEIIFPETTTYGVAPMPNNFESLCYLFAGSGPLRTLGRTAGIPIVGRLNPMPMSTNNLSPTINLNIADVIAAGGCSW